ncbi:MAG: hypothetical protein ACFFB8_16905 [Promethearchaeota archaeon]
MVPEEIHIINNQAAELKEEQKLSNELNILLSIKEYNLSLIITINIFFYLISSSMFISSAKHI